MGLLPTCLSTSEELSDPAPKRSPGPWGKAGEHSRAHDQILETLEVGYPHYRLRLEDGGWKAHPTAACLSSKGTQPRESRHLKDFGFASSGDS